MVEEKVEYAFEVLNTIECRPFRGRFMVCSVSGENGPKDMPHEFKDVYSVAGDIIVLSGFGGGRIWIKTNPIGSKAKVVIEHRGETAFPKGYDLKVVV